MIVQARLEPIALKPDCLPYFLDELGKLERFMRLDPDKPHDRVIDGIREYLTTLFAELVEMVAAKHSARVVNGTIAIVLSSGGGYYNLTWLLSGTRESGQVVTLSHGVTLVEIEYSIDASDLAKDHTKRAVQWVAAST